MSHGTSIAGDVLADLVVAPPDPVRPDDVRDRVAAAAVVERVLQLGPDVLLEIRQVRVVQRLQQLLRDQVDDVRAGEADDDVEPRPRRTASFAIASSAELYVAICDLARRTASRTA